MAEASPTPDIPAEQPTPSDLTAAATRWTSQQILGPALGGATTVTGLQAARFGAPAPNLSAEEQDLFQSGELLFLRPWSVAGSQNTTRDGLGPLFNAQSCAACHIGTGRGLPPHPSSQLIPLGLLVRLSVPGADPVTGGPVPEPTYGLQLQDRSGLTLAAEGKVAVTYETIVGTYGDGSSYLLDAPTYAVTELGYGPLAVDTMISPRFAQQVIGMGLLEAIPEASLVAAADPDDENGDGISGKVNYVWEPARESTMVGRFGWKANIATVEAQVADAFHGDLGVTSIHNLGQNCPTPQNSSAATVCLDAPAGAPPGETELTDSQLDAVTFFNRTLAVPAARPATAEVTKGAEAFLDFGCAACHTPIQQSGPSDSEVLSNQTFAPFSDLLLHDMGAGLADGRPDFDATGSEWRTAPLWGLGLIDDSTGERFLLHDGRADSIEAAILWHGGEAEPAREAFRLAELGLREALLAFLETL